MTTKQTTAEQKLLTTRDVAQLLDISPQRVRQLVRDRDDFPAPAIESRTERGVGTRRWRRQDVERWAASADRSHGRRWPR
jgi:predicted DNA-binding transcriptional regulator AlpA